MLLRFFVCISVVRSVGGTSRNSQNSSSSALEEAENSRSNAMINFWCIFSHSFCRKGVPNSPRIITTGPGGLGPVSNGTSPKGPLNPQTAQMRSRGGVIGEPQSIPTSRPLLQYHPGEATYATALPAVPNPALQLANPTTQTTVALPPQTNSLPVHESLRRYFVNSTTKFFGLNGEESNEKVWIDRRRRVAIKLFGGVKDDFHIDGTSTFDDSLVITYSRLVVDGWCTVI